MTKTLTEQWKNGELTDGIYYVSLRDSNDIHIRYLDQTKYSVYFKCFKEVLAPVLPYRILYDKDQGIFPVLNIVLRNIEREQCRRKLTDLELSIKSQVKGVLAAHGLVSNPDESVQKMHILEKKLAIATKALEYYDGLENIIIDWKLLTGQEAGTARKALKEMEV